MESLFVTCPYNQAHRVPQIRIQAHIVRCNDKRSDFVACPYNATHRLPQQEMKIHIKQCPSVEAIFPENKPPKVIADLRAPRPILQKEYLPETDPNHELWDD